MCPHALQQATHTHPGAALRSDRSRMIRSELWPPMSENLNRTIMRGKGRPDPSSRPLD